eukprot:gene12170-5660_t
MNNSTTQVFTFLAPDGILIGLQTITVFLAFIVFLLLVLFRNTKEIKYRGILPFLGGIPIILYVLRMYLGTFSWLRSTNPSSFTYDFSCWWSMLTFFPFVAVFSFFQTLYLAKYLLNQRLDSLKDLTWGFYDDRNSKNLKKLKEQTKIKNEEKSKKSERRKSKVELEIELKDVSKENEKSNPSSSNTYSVDFDDEEVKEIRRIITKVKIAKFFTSNFLSFWLPFLLFW